MNPLLVVLADTPSNTTANIIAAIAAVITALGVLPVGAALLVTALRTNRKVARVEETVGVTHTIVNQISTDKDRRIVALTQQLIDANMVPVIDQSLPVPGQPDAQPGQPLVESASSTPTPDESERPPLVMKEVRDGDNAP